MSVIDILILAAAAVGTVCAVLSIWRNKGGCSGCSGCDGNCGSCAYKDGGEENGRK